MIRISALDELVDATFIRRRMFSAAPPPTREDFEVGLEVYDIVDGYYVIRPVVKLQYLGRNFRALLGAEASVDIDLSGGPATATRDPANGNILVSTSSRDPIFGRSAVGTRLGGDSITLTSDPFEIGIDPSRIPPSEQQVSVAGGGACASRFFIGDPVDSEVQVRASLMATALPRSVDRREVLWRHGRYFAYNPVLGFMSLYYDPERTSRTTMLSANPNPADDGFFPAETVNELHFICDFVDLGIKAFSKVPMRQTISGATWPPYSTTPIGIDGEVDFYDLENPDRHVMRIVEQSLYLYDYNSLDIELLSQDVRDGVLYTSWRVHNQARVPIHVRWFLLGDFGRDSRFPHEGNRLMSGSGSAEDTMVIQVSVPVERSSLPQTVSMNVVSLRMPILAGQSSLSFINP
ncbi:MAG TPA: hypothetical protein VF662_09420 [Allosphingosinicella sp.]|jgi:hypothetical protein